LIVAFEWIRRRSQYGHIVIPIYNHQRSQNKPGWPRRLAKQNVRLASVKRAKDVRRGDEVALFVDEEAVPVEKVVIAPLGRSLIHGIDNRANGSRQQRIVCGHAGHCMHCQGPQNASNGGERFGDPFAIQFHGDTGKVPSPTATSIAEPPGSAIDLWDSPITLETFFRIGGSNSLDRGR
jgi:hypothetical protein